MSPLCASALCGGRQTEAVHEGISLRLPLLSRLLALTLEPPILVHLLRLHLDSVLQHPEWTRARWRGEDAEFLLRQAYLVSESASASVLAYAVFDTYTHDA